MSDSPVHAIDLRLGRRLREERQQRGVSQERLAEALGVSFQQVQKYETAANRISASRLWQAAEALQVPIQVFFEAQATAARPAAASG